MKFTVCVRNIISYFFQEHWLLPHDLNFMSSIHPDFLYFGHSSVDTSSGILVGRPYGGTGILYRKSLSSCIAPIDTLDGRLTVIIFRSRSGPIFLISVNQYTTPEIPRVLCFSENCFI